MTKESATITDLILVLAIIIYCSVMLYRAEQRPEPLPLIYEMETVTRVDEHGRCFMIYEFLIDGQHSHVVLYDQDGDRHLGAELKAFKEEYLSKIGEAWK
jgi:hypothetical protein